MGLPRYVRFLMRLPTGWVTSISYCTSAVVNMSKLYPGKVLMSCCSVVLAGSIWLKRLAAASSQFLMSAPFTFTAYTVLGYR